MATPTKRQQYATAKDDRERWTAFYLSLPDEWRNWVDDRAKMLYGYNGHTDGKFTKIVPGMNVLGARELVLKVLIFLMNEAPELKPRIWLDASLEGLADAKRDAEYAERDKEYAKRSKP